jgi:cell division protein ZipA
MDFGLREWLFIFGLLVIAGILFDGWRRMGGRSRIRFKLERNLSDLPEEGGNDELLGPPRVVGQRDRAEPSFGDEINDLGQPDADISDHEPEQVGLDLDEPPVLIDPVAVEARSTSQKPRAAESGQEPPPLEEVLVINVVSRDEQGFAGSALHQNIMESGLRYGEMNIFHRHESMSGNGDVLFSMANALKPGVFDLDELDKGHVRAVSFFMGLPGPRHPKQALDLMIAAARKLSQELGGDLKDEQRSVLTAQTIEHYRQRIAESERRHYSMRR